MVERRFDRGFLRGKLGSGRVVVWPRLTPVFQPVVRLRDEFEGESAAVGVEGLSRFPDTPLVAVEEVFASARRLGGGIALEVRAIAAQLPVLGQLPAEWFLSVNASPETVTSGELHSLLRSVDGGRVVVEVTETAPIDDYSRFNRAMDRLRSDGVRLAIDDLGAGFASLRHLLHLRPEFVKLDLSIVQGVAEDQMRQSLVMALSSFAADIGAEIIAEGLERTDDARTVAMFGARLGQGFLLGRPDSMLEMSDA